MYAKMVLASGCTLQQLRDDLVGLLTGTISAAASLTSCTVASSEVVKTVNPEWTFVQHLADTSSRCHFVLSGVDDGGASKTLGVIMTNVSGVLAMMFWTAGAWDSTNKRPAAIDVTGYTLATSYATSAYFAAGTTRNTICVAGIASGTLTGPTVSLAAFTTGAMQLQVSSYQGATTICAHYNTNHPCLLDHVDIPRVIGGELINSTNWPWALCSVRSPFYSTSDVTVGAGPMLSYNVTGAANNGVTIGTNTVPALGAPFSTELGCTTYLPAHSAINGATNAFAVSRTSLVPARWLFSKTGVQQLVIPELTMYSASSVLPGFTIPKRVAGQIITPGTATSAYTAYLDEIVTGSDTFVSVGGAATAGHAAMALYKG